MFTKILVPLDGSSKSFEALDLASNLAITYKAEIFLICVFKPYSFLKGTLSIIKDDSDISNIENPLEEYSKEIVKEGKKILHEKNIDKIRAFVKTGSAAKEILKFSKKHSIDLIIIGSKGQGELSGYLLGGVSHKVTGLAKCPVLVV